MAACDNQVGVKNILITFYDCDTDEEYGPISHELATDELPQLRLCDSTNEALPGGYVRKSKGNNEITFNVIRNIGIPLAMYQGCSSVSIQIEYFNGIVISASDGTGTGDETSDGHEAPMTMTFREVDELLPSGVIDSNNTFSAAA